MKGVINENIIAMLNLRPLDEVLKEQGVDPQPVTDEVQPTVTAVRDLSAKLNMIEGSDHGEAMDELHNEILQHARDLMAYGFNIDHPRARGIFEVAASFYNHALVAKNAKRESQLKSMKLAMDKKRLELEEKRTNQLTGGAPAINNETTILVEDRNELLRRLRQQITE